jgi:hypothetical protein
VKLCLSTLRNLSRSSTLDRSRSRLMIGSPNLRDSQRQTWLKKMNFSSSCATSCSMDWTSLRSTSPCSGP